MAKMKSWDELRKIRDSVKDGTHIRTTGENPDRVVLAVGMATCGIAAGARKTLEALLAEIQGAALRDISVISTGCFGYCYAEPMVEVRMPGKPAVKYGHVDEALAREIVQKHIISGELLDKSIIGQEVDRP